jgi:hypothetical protein
MLCKPTAPDANTQNYLFKDERLLNFFDVLGVIPLRVREAE